MITERLAAQLLSGPPARRAVDVVRRLLAVQGQDPRGARLAIRARSIGLRAADVDNALTTERSLVITWFNRGTLHLVHRDDYWWLHALTTPQLFTGNARRLAEEGVSPEAAERGVAVIEHSLSAEGPLTRAALRGRIAAVGVPVAGQALAHLLMLASLRGLVVRGPMVSGDHAFVLVKDWLGPAPARLDRDVALAELARRYLLGHGPAADRDLARWAGLSLGAARRGIAAVGSQLRERPDGLVDLAHGSRPVARSAPRLLGAFDPLLLGWVSREPILGTHQGVVTMNGVFRPFALVRGKAAATWRMIGDRVELSPFRRLTNTDAAALEKDATDVQRFLGANRSIDPGVKRP